MPAKSQYSGRKRGTVNERCRVDPDSYRGGMTAQNRVVLNSSFVGMKLEGEIFFIHEWR